MSPPHAVASTRSTVCARHSVDRTTIVEGPDGVADDRRVVRRRSLAAEDHGAVTAEFAVVLPVLVALLAGALAAVLVVDARGRLVVAAATAARALGRDDDGAAASAVRRIAPGAVVTVAHPDGLVCVTATRAVAIGVLPAIGSAATECAADGGR